MAKLEMTGVASVKREDSGMALILEINEPSNQVEGWFVRLQSYSGQKLHPDLEPLIGKMLRVTIEVL